MPLPVEEENAGARFISLGILWHFHRRGE